MKVDLVGQWRWRRGRRIGLIQNHAFSVDNAPLEDRKTGDYTYKVTALVDNPNVGIFGNITTSLGGAYTTLANESHSHIVVKLSKKQSQHLSCK